MSKGRNKTLLNYEGTEINFKSSVIRTKKDVMKISTVDIEQRWKKKVEK